MTTEQRRKVFEQWLETVKYDNSDILSPSGLAWHAWQAALQKLQEEYCPLSDPNHPHGIRFREDSPTPTPMKCPKCNEDIMSMSVHYCNSKTKRTMNDTPTTNARWERLCCSGQSWYQIAEEMKLDCRQSERELASVTEQRGRLAEALRKIKNAGGTYTDPYDELDFIDGITYEALQSLNQPTEP